MTKSVVTCNEKREIISGFFVLYTDIMKKKTRFFSFWACVMRIMTQLVISFNHITSTIETYVVHCIEIKWNNKF